MPQQRDTYVVSQAVARSIAERTGAQVRVQQLGPEVLRPEVAAITPPMLELRLALDGREVPLLGRMLSASSEPVLLRAGQALATEAMATDAVPILILTRSSAGTRVRLREHGINYVDLAGNLFVRAPGLLLSHEGTSTSRHDAVRDAARRATRAPAQRVNPFSKRASLVLRYLFDMPGGVHIGKHPVTEIAAATGLTHVWVLRVLAELERSRYISREEERRVTLVDVPAVLRDWRVTYDWTRNDRTAWVVPYEAEELRAELPKALAELSWAYTALAGSDLVAPHVHHVQTHLYVAREQMDTAADRLVGRLHARPATEGGTVHLLTPYYADAAFFGLREVGAAPVVSDLQLFLDLAGFPLRGREAAGMLVRARMARHLGLSPKQVATILSDLDR